ncbi:Pectinesterase/pectinesterase inhibitor 18 [Raphanus sativus]|uniref:Pectinesterase n=1 Tax=Raphanus sativus TaxID=3726 RepID=A0A6J0M6M0_RAPSA|nr:probable pectinesterase 56 [Raphanus sativus]KAJ4912968.1 Pectinesterase/pectinesterase inhibitor 18 [Raphanus sativus]
MYFPSPKFSIFLVLITFTSLALAVDELPSWMDKNFLNNYEVLKSNADLVVAKDGSGDFLTIKEAIATAPEKSPKQFVIYIKAGVYSEIIEIGVTKTHITLVGDGRDSTILTGSLNQKDGVKTFLSATLAVDGDDFRAQDLCVKNTAGPAKEQAVALRVSAERVVIYRCRIDAYQDTLYAYKGKQYYRDTYITGTVDFIFGHGQAVFQYCEIVARKPIGGQANMITAQNRGNQDQKSAFTIQRCNITASADLIPFKTTVKTYLGRPWGVMATVVIMESFIDDHIDPAGWYPWNEDKERLSTLYYGEYNNYGPRANTSQRVKWKGFRAIQDPKEAARFTVGQLIDGELWLNSTGVPYESGL